MNKITWKSEIIEVLKILGEANLDEILEKVKERKNINLSKSKTPKKTISRTLQTYTYSTEYGIEDTFHNVYGVSKKRGVWALSNNYDIKPSGENIDISFKEGAEIIKKHKSRERNPKLRTIAIQNFKETHSGKLYCEVCGFDFFDTYGEIGADFIEIHHIKPLSQMRNDERTKIQDIAMLCSNCHSIIHRKQPWLSKEELYKIFRARKGKL